jgi:hypothetical protein
MISMKTSETVKNVGDIFSCWQSLPEMASDIGESHWAVRKWKQRGRIPDTAWTNVIEGLRRKGKNLSAEGLLVMHARRKSAVLARASR